MHRSGATAFGRVLNLLGCDLPTSVVPAATDATEGAMFQSDAIRQLNDRILASAGTRWDDWLEFHPGWLQSPRAAEFRDEALALLHQEFGASRLFVLNDPRMCRLVPFWLGVLDAAGVQPLILSPVRSPLAVAAALQERDGLSPGLGHLIWLRHVLDAEFASRGTKRFFTSYDQLTSGWARTTTAASSTLGIAWPRLSDKAAVEIESFLSTNCRDDRQQVANGVDNPTLSDWLRSTSDILGRWSVERETPQDFARLDEIRMAMNTAAPAFSRLLGTEQARTACLEMELASERQQASQLKNELESRAEAAEQELASERRQASQLKSELESRVKAAEQELASERRRQEQAAAEAEKSLAELRHRLAQTESALAQRSHETEQTAGELAAAREDLRQMGAARAEAEAAQAQAEKVSAGLKQHLDVLLADVKQRQTQAVEQAARQADEDASLATQVKQVLAVLDTSRHELAMRLSEAEQMRATQAAELQQRLDEIETLKQQHSEIETLKQQRSDEVETLKQQRLDEIEALKQQRLDEIEALKRTVEETQSELHHQQSEAERLRQVAALEIGRAAGLINDTGTSTVRRRLRLMWGAARLKRSGLFDAEWYRRHNADVAGAGIDPLHHYVQFGASEGRAPNPKLVSSNGKS